MKINYLKKLVMTVFAVLCFSTLLAQPEQVFMIGGPLNKNHPNWLLDHKVELTKDAADPFLFHFKGYLAYNWRGDEPGNLKFLTHNDWSNGYHPNTAENQLLAGTTPIRQGGDDTKWFIPADRSGDGYYEFTINTRDMNLTVNVFRHDLNPGKIYGVGSAMPCGWNNSNPEVFERINPEVAIYQWTGVLNSGEFKFLAPLSLGNWDYGYCATTASEPVTYSTEQNLVFEVRNSSLTTFDDFKFVMSETAECTVTVDLDKMTMVVTKGGEPVARDIWIMGSAIPGGKAKLVGSNIDPIINYQYHGELLTGEFKFATTEVAGPTTEYFIPLSASDAIAATDVVVTADNAAPGWTVTQANSMYKVKLNVLANKYKAWIHNIEHVYIVGGATEIGWDAGNAIELTRGTGAESDIFTFDGILAVNPEGSDRNMFKFLLQKDWGPASFHPQIQNEPITSAKFFTDRVSDDYKWTVDESKPGRYIIKLNALEETIEATYMVGTAAESVKDNQLTITPADGKIAVRNAAASKLTAEVYSFDGRRVASREFSGTTEIKVSSGMYILRVKEGDATLVTRKISVL